MRQAAPNMCDIRHNAKAPGLEGETVSPSVSRTLRNRAVHYEWDTLWRALFPRDKVVPKPGKHPFTSCPATEKLTILQDFEPLVELHEVHREHIYGLTELRQKLHTALKSSLPDNQLLGRGDLIPNEELCLDELESAVKDHMDGIFMKAKANAFVPSVASQPAVKATSHSPRDTPSPRSLRPHQRTPSTTGSRPSSSTGGATSLHSRFDALHTPSINSGASSPTSLLRNVHSMGTDTSSQPSLQPHAASAELSRLLQQNGLLPQAPPYHTNSNLPFDQIAAAFSTQLSTNTSTTQSSQSFMTSYGSSQNQDMMGFPSQAQPDAPSAIVNHQRANGIGNHVRQPPLGNPSYDCQAQLSANMNWEHSNPVNQTYPPPTFTMLNHGTGFMTGVTNAGVDHMTIAQRIHDNGHGGVNGWAGGGNLQQGGILGRGPYGMGGNALSEDPQFHFPSSG